MKTVAISLDLAQRVLADLQQNIEDICGCDHNVGICCCDQIRNVVDFAEAVIFAGGNA